MRPRSQNDFADPVHDNLAAGPVHVLLRAPGG
jgi:hypothetical protein